MLQQALNNEFYQRKIARQCISFVTQVRVDGDDPDFANPTKPIGGFLDEITARKFEEGWLACSGRCRARVAAGGCLSSAGGDHGA
jgi:carbamate kinase